MTGGWASPLEGSPLTEAGSAAKVALYAELHGDERTTATTYLNDNVVVCVLEDIRGTRESLRVAAGEDGDVS